MPMNINMVRNNVLVDLYTCVKGHRAIVSNDDLKSIFSSANLKNASQANIDFVFHELADKDHDLIRIFKIRNPENPKEYVIVNHIDDLSKDGGIPIPDLRVYTPNGHSFVVTKHTRGLYCFIITNKFAQKLLHAKFNMKNHHMMIKL